MRDSRVLRRVAAHLTASACLVAPLDELARELPDSHAYKKVFTKRWQQGATVTSRERRLPCVWSCCGRDADRHESKLSDGCVSLVHDEKFLSRTLNMFDVSLDAIWMHACVLIVVAGDGYQQRHSVAR